MTLLDIVICTHNRADSLRACLDGLAGQRAAEDGAWRVLVIDNASPDATAEVVRAYAATKRIQDLVYVLEPKLGLTPARQRGVLESDARWIAFVDDDNLLDGGWVAAALRFAAEHPEAGGFGGRVLPSWGRVPPPHLVRHGWLFAQQDNGQEVRQVESLVGAGIVLNRRALAESGWTAEPLLADRTGRSHVSGGDVEISLRLAAGGHPLWYVPEMWLDHVIARDRQSLGRLLSLAEGLGAGAEFAGLLAADSPRSWRAAEERAIEEDVRRHRAALRHTLRTYPWRDWLIRRAFLRGRRSGLAALADQQNFARLANALPRGVQGAAGRRQA